MGSSLSNQHNGCRNCCFGPFHDLCPDSGILIKSRIDSWQTEPRRGKMRLLDIPEQSLPHRRDKLSTLLKVMSAASEHSWQVGLEASQQAERGTASPDWIPYLIQCEISKGLILYPRFPVPLPGQPFFQPSITPFTDKYESPTFGGTNPSEISWLLKRS